MVIYVGIFNSPMSLPNVTQGLDLKWFYKKYSGKITEAISVILLLRTVRSLGNVIKPLPKEGYSLMDGSLGFELVLFSVYPEDTREV